MVEHTPRQWPKEDDAPCHRRQPGQLSPPEIAWQRDVAASPIGAGEVLLEGDLPAASPVGVFDCGPGAPVVENDLPADVREVGQGAAVLEYEVLAGQREEGHKVVGVVDVVEVASRRVPPDLVGVARIASAGRSERVATLEPLLDETRCERLYWVEGG